MCCSFDSLATPKDTWPKMEKLGTGLALFANLHMCIGTLFLYPGLTMVQGEAKNQCQYFHFEHSPDYQKIQHRFWESVESFDPNSITVRSYSRSFSS